MNSRERACNETSYPTCEGRIRSSLAPNKGLQPTASSVRSALTSVSALKRGRRFHRLIARVVVNYTQKEHDRISIQGD